MFFSNLSGALSLEGVLTGLDLFLDTERHLVANLKSNLFFVYLPIGLITMLSARMEIQMMARLIGKKSKVILMQPKKPNGKNVLR